MAAWLRIKALRTLPGLLISLGLGASCTPSTPPELPAPMAAPAPSLGTPVAEGATEDTRFVAATVELTCLGRRAPPPEQLAKETRVIYQRYGFEEPMQYLALVSTLGEDPAIAQRVRGGTRECPQ